MPKGIRVDYSQWGIDVAEFAAKEGVSTNNIAMRVKNFGTPFQRKANPTKWEKKYCKTMLELTAELGIHPQSIVKREKVYGDVYRDRGCKMHNKGKFNVMPTRYKAETWLCEEHPLYDAWRHGELFS